MSQFTSNQPYYVGSQLVDSVPRRRSEAREVPMYTAPNDSNYDWPTGVHDGYEPVQVQANTYSPSFPYLFPTTSTYSPAPTSSPAIIYAPYNYDGTHATSPHYFQSDPRLEHDMQMRSSRESHRSPPRTRHSPRTSPVFQNSLPLSDDDGSLKEYFIMAHEAQLKNDKALSRRAQNLRSSIVQNKRSKAVQHSRCLWDSGRCDAILDDLSPSGISRHLASYHMQGQTHEVCKWGNCDHGDTMKQTSLGKHISCVHLKHDNWLCPFCGTDFCRWDSLKRHVDASCTSVSWAH
ncbi:hypothetical protein CERSUDRAFT_117725 [Gelatoporia subvermispora B]|uniref:C2H2-type domain-containing protein n=1 Tax=Ceriporiopsis subvermispora (strain B) TaxID=914234 RepID=M2R3W4_CERS8|nr:hypothetical protein CERSUDRAFT_117725 [Gelatoporia subvermispora B]